jgi:hypothetical protein
LVVQRWQIDKHGAQLSGSSNIKVVSFSSEALMNVAVDVG